MVKAKNILCGNPVRIARIGGMEIAVSGALPVLFILSWIFEFLDLALLAFAVVMFHETAHLITALWLSVPLERLEIFPFGGVLRISGNQVFNMDKEVLVAAAGPLASLILAGIIYGGQYFSFWTLKGNYETFVFQVTLMMAIINLAPALPLDGGRIFRAILAKRIGYLFATRFTASLGQWLAAGWFLWGVWSFYCSFAQGYWLLIAAYFFSVAGKEKKRVFLDFIRFLTNKYQETHQCQFNPVLVLAVAGHTSLKDVVTRLVPQRYHLIFVIDQQGRCTGPVSEAAVIRRALTGGWEITLEEIWQEESGGRRNYENGC